MFESIESGGMSKPMEKSLSRQALGWEGMTSGLLPGLRGYPLHFHIRFSRVAGWWNVCVCSLRRVGIV
jgi:hypothetical protein